MNRILIINSSLVMGGAEKLLYELAVFAKQNNIEPTILILGNYDKQYYDDIFKHLKITVVRTRLNNLKHFRAPKRMLCSIYWAAKLRFFAGSIYDSVHIMGLYHVDGILGSVNHKHKFYWHLTNAIQNTGSLYNFPDRIFQNEHDTIICINKYQLDELTRQYGERIKSKLSLFKLFTTVSNDLS